MVVRQSGSILIAYPYILKGVAGDSRNSKGTDYNEQNQEQQQIDNGGKGHLARMGDGVRPLQEGGMAQSRHTGLVRVEDGGVRALRWRRAQGAGEALDGRGLPWSRPNAITRRCPSMFLAARAASAAAGCSRRMEAMSWSENDFHGQRSAKDGCASSREAQLEALNFDQSHLSANCGWWRRILVQSLSSNFDKSNLSANWGCLARRHPMV